MGFTLSQNEVILNLSIMPTVANPTTIPQLTQLRRRQSYHHRPPSPSQPRRHQSHHQQTTISITAPPSPIPSPLSQPTTVVVHRRRSPIPPPLQPTVAAPIVATANFRYALRRDLLFAPLPYLSLALPKLPDPSTSQAST
ncbi:hypothetical protein TIFTF001_004048 [Ficus carica]|uniref:Uncharacterized protein n=1 Tax=Ficus carica TaxID=3494 RepID=A0AA88CX32_FICCA|nr:hypothetical protein TIFTF001_004048 [Ficus carica]